MQRFDTHAVEAKWRQRWSDDRLYETSLGAPKRPFYNLVEFPYPSGEGLHVGHVYTYCGADALGRLRRMQGYEVFQPMGFDSFGIHSENYALLQRTHPAELIPANIRRFRAQLDRLGCQFDWSHTLNTSDPEYYRWSQWIFVQLYWAGLAYRAEAPVNWCPSCRTVLANEQVVDGVCERCRMSTEQRNMLQWFFRITAYADGLLDFSQAEFPQAVQRKQTEWIGRSEGAEIRFRVPGGKEHLAVFTTRPDTLFGATFLVMAPEHPLVARLTTSEHATAVQRYVEQAARKSERDRITTTDKTGVFTGSFAEHPVTGEPVPVWIGDYVLARYGCGAVMGVPAHDARDLAFARRYALPERVVVVGGEGDPAAVPYEGEGLLVASGAFTGMPSECARTAITGWLTERGLGEHRVTYRLRDWIISRQRYWGPPIPIVYCSRCGTVPVPEDQLPVLLPHVEAFRPEGTGKSPLASVPEFVQTDCPQCGGPAERETDVSDNFLDSAWYFLRYPSTEWADRPWDPERTRHWLPVDQYAGGPEHATMHHLYARFITRALHDLSLVPFAEPFARLRLHGTITRDGAKMSKSRGNVVSPDRYLTEHGCDAFRMYMLFLGPWEHGGDFSDAGLSGIPRFLSKVWEAFDPQRLPNCRGRDASPEVERRRHRLIARVTEAIETLRFHVAIAALMEEIARLRDHTSELTRDQWRAFAVAFAHLLAPLAPHFAEELWERWGGRKSIHRQPWPQFDPEMLAEETIELAVQINGKLRLVLAVPAGADREGAIHLARESEEVTQVLAGREPKKVVYVPGKVVNFVV